MNRHGAVIVKVGNGCRAECRCGRMQAKQAITVAGATRAWAAHMAQAAEIGAQRKPRHKIA